MPRETRRTRDGSAESRVSSESRAARVFCPLVCISPKFGTTRSLGPIYSANLLPFRDHLLP